MSVIRIQKNSSNPYVMIDRKVIQDNSLSINARFILIYMLSMPDTWEFHLNEIVSHFKDHISHRTMRRIFKELIQSGYLVKNNSRRGSGVFRCHFYDLHEQPSSSRPNMTSTTWPNNDMWINGQHSNNERSDQTNTERSEEICRVETRPTSDMQEVFDFWKAEMNHPKAILCAKRRRLIQTYLKPYGKEGLKRAVLGCKASPFHMGDNDRSQRYDSLELILRDSKRVEEFMSFADKPPSKQKSKGFQRNTDSDMERFNRLQGIFGPKTGAKDIEPNSMEVRLIN